MSEPAKPLTEAPAPDEIDEAWTDEVRRRAEELDAGTAKVVPADEVFAKARKLIDDHRD